MFDAHRKIYNLGEVCNINSENMKPKEYSEINYVDISSVKRGKILEITKITKNFPSRAKRIIKKGDILYSSVRPNLKGYVYISKHIENGIASTGFANIRVKQLDIVLSKYLYYIITSDYINNYLISKAKGAQYPAVSFDEFKNIKIPIPSLKQQQEIVEKCDHIQDLIKMLEKDIEYLKDISKQILESYISKKLTQDNVDIVYEDIIIEDSEE